MTNRLLQLQTELQKTQRTQSTNRIASQFGGDDPLEMFKDAPDNAWVEMIEQHLKDWRKNNNVKSSVESYLRQKINKYLTDPELSGSPIDEHTFKKAKVYETQKGAEWLIRANTGKPLAKLWFRKIPPIKTVTPSIHENADPIFEYRTRAVYIGKPSTNPPLVIQGRKKALPPNKSNKIQHYKTSQTSQPKIGDNQTNANASQPWTPHPKQAQQPKGGKTVFKPQPSQASEPWANLGTKQSSYPKKGYNQTNANTSQPWTPHPKQAQRSKGGKTVFKPQQNVTDNPWAELGGSPEAVVSSPLPTPKTPYRPGQRPAPLQKIHLDSNFIRAAEHAHNKRRQRFMNVNIGGTNGLPDLKWYPPLAEMAQEWAERIAADLVPVNPKTRQHRTGLERSVYSYQAIAPAGENINQSHEVYSPERDIQDAVAGWFGEWVTYYHPKTGHKITSETGHYTQVVWKSSTQLGCGRAISPDGKTVVIVCNYLPTGNYPQKLGTNVPEKALSSQYMI